MRRRIVGLVLVLSAMALSPVLALRVLANHEVPVKASYVGKVTVATDLGGDLHHLAYEAVGTATHVGRHTVTGHFLVDLATGDMLGFMTLTAANGDQVFLKYVGDVLDATDAEFTAKVIGGTGRFAHATGTMHAAAVVGANETITGQAHGNIAFK